MNEILSRIVNLLKAYSDHPHILIPRSGNSVVQSLKAIGVDSFGIWRYYEDPSSEFVRPTMFMPVQASTSFELADHWWSEAYGARFPELLYLPEHTTDEVYRVLSRLCEQRDNSALCEKYLGKIKNKLVDLDWVIAPIHVTSFGHDEPTYHCMVLSNDIENIDLVEMAMSELSVSTFKFVPGSNEWPVSLEAENEACRLWESELKVERE